MRFAPEFSYLRELQAELVREMLEDMIGDVHLPRHPVLDRGDWDVQQPGELVGLASMLFLDRLKEDVAAGFFQYGAGDGKEFFPSS